MVKLSTMSILFFLLLKLLLIQFESCKAEQTCQDYYDCHSTEICSPQHECICRIGFFRIKNQTITEGCIPVEIHFEWNLWNIFDAFLNYRIPQIFLLLIIFIAFAHKIFYECQSKNYENLHEDDHPKRIIV